MMKLKYLVLLILTSFIFVCHSNAQISIGSLNNISYDNPKEYEIGGITVSGVKYLDNNVLIMLSGLSVGDRIMVPGDKISSAIRKLWKQGLFNNVSIYATKIQGNLIFLNIDLKERPRLSKYKIEGVKKSDAENIRDNLHLMAGDVVTENLILRIENTIKNYFTDKGFLNARADITEVFDTTKANNVILNIDIERGDRVRILKINVHGNENLSDAQIKSALKDTKEKGVIRPMNKLDSLFINVISDVFALDFYAISKDFNHYIDESYKIRIFKGSKFIKDSYEEDKANLIKKYNENGYRDAHIVRDSVYKVDDRTIEIDLVVDEGEKYYFRNINWVGNTKYTENELNAILKIQKGDVYNKDRLETNLNYNPTGFDVSSLYLDDGYLFFNVQPVEVNVEGDSIDLELRIHEGKQARINKVTVTGNTRTNDHVIIRELRTKPGQLFSRSDIIRTQRELAQLRYFNAETLGLDYTPNPADGTVDIEYQVEETSADQIELSGGWGYGRIIGTLGLSFNNFSLRNFFKKDAWRPIPSGDGQKLSLRVQTYGSGYISYGFSFTEPWLGGKKPNAFSVSYYHALYSNGLDKGDPLRSEFINNSVTIGLGKRLQWPDDFFTLYQSINLQWYNLSNYTSIFNFGSGSGDFYNFSYLVAFGRSSIDAPIYPRSGSDVSISLELTPPYSLFSDKDYATMSEDEKYKWIEYHKWKFKSDFYTKLVGDLVLSTRVRFGFLGKYNSEIGVTPFERFYVGGDGLYGYNNLDGREIVALRGYGNETITPNYAYNSSLGGTIYDKYTLELRYPLSLNPSATIYALTFVEGGNSWGSFRSFSPFDVYKSAGVGIRIFLPMFGVLGLDYGYGFDEVPGIPDANGAHFHFSINQSLD
jgi:outer membrane protein insertion porin family